MGLLLAGASAAWGYALIGSFPSWQTSALGYNLAATAATNAPGGPVNLSDLGGPMQLGEGYRRNALTYYYAYDANFLGFFGSNGVVAVDSAFNVMNNAFTKNPLTGQILTNGVDSMSPSLSEYPTESAHVNYQAQALFLTDLKSVTLHLLVEQLGLAEPERYTWTLAANPSTGLYMVIQRNYDILNSPLNQVQYSPYVNNTLYTYEIVAIPTGFRTATFPVDPYADVYTAVADNNMNGLNIGGYYTGLTLDDMAGFRYLYSTNNVAWEDASSGALLMTTNYGSVGPSLTTTNLYALLTAAPTNDPATLATMFPDVVLAGTATNFSLAPVWNVAYGTNLLVGAPYGSSVVPSVSSNLAGTFWQTNYTETYANVITNGNLNGYPGVNLNGHAIHLDYFTNTIVDIVTVVAHQPLGAPYGTIATNSYTNRIVSPVASGEYFVLPASQCGWELESGQAAYTPMLVSNAIPLPTNSVSSTNYPIILAQYSLTYFTNHTFLVKPLTCTTATDASQLRQGVEKVQFVRADYDSLLGQFWQPFTNYYSMTIITNSQYQSETFQRVLTQPDFVFDASDTMAAVNGVVEDAVTRDITFQQAANSNPLQPQLAGPGVINPTTTFTYNRVGIAFQNGTALMTAAQTNAFELYQMPLLQWANFDGTTNLPELFPSGQSIQNLINEMVIQVTPPPPILTDGTNGAVYAPIAFTATGGAFNPPFTWSLGNGSALPGGLTLTSGGVLSSSGNPLHNVPIGEYDFVIQLTDSLGRSVNWNYTLTIH